MVLHCEHVTFCVNIPLNRSQNITIELCRFSSYVMLFSGSSDCGDTVWSSSSKHCLRPIKYPCASSEVSQDELFVSGKHVLKIYSFVHWVVMVLTFVLFKIFITPVKSIQLLKIDNIISTTDHGINHRCKLKKELETFMLFVCWTLQEIRKITTTCNALGDGISIVDEATVAESCMCVVNTYISSSCILNKTPIIWTINSIILSYSLLYCPLFFLLMTSSFLDFHF
jgi:hypothetical protein